MKGLLLGALVFFSIPVLAQTKASAGNSKKAAAVIAAGPAKSSAVSLANKSTTDNGATPIKPVMEFPSDSLKYRNMKVLDFKYRDSVLKYRDLMLYYQQTAGPKDTTARHYQRIAMYFQKKHFELNKPAIAYNDSLMKAGRKVELEKKYNIKLH